MLITVTRNNDDVSIEVDTDRYKLDPAYKHQIHSRLGIADGQEDFDWDYICATEEEYEPGGAKLICDTRDYPSEEAAEEALERLLRRIYEDALSEAADETPPDIRYS